MDATMDVFATTTSNMMTTSEPFLDTVCYYYTITIYGVVLLALCLVAFVGNLVNIVIWVKVSLWRGFHSSIVLIQFLAIIGCLNQIPTILVIILPHIGIVTGTLWTYLCQYYPHCSKYIWPFATVGNFCTVWLTMLITVHRYSILCKPFSMVTQKMTSVRATFIQGTCIVALGVVYASPRFLEEDITAYEFPDGTTCLYTMPSQLLLSQSYNLYYTTLSFFILVICIPIGISTALTFRILRFLVKARAKREEMTANRSSASSKEAAITKTLLVIVIIFIICQIPNTCLRIWLTVTPELRIICGEAVFFIDPIIQLFIPFNEAVNVFVYSQCSQDFQTMLRHMCCRTKLPSRASAQSTTHGRSDVSVEDTNI